MKIKFFVALSLVFTFVLSSGFSAYASQFSDVPNDYVNKNAIEFLKENSYINGYADGTFKPENNISRAEAVKVVVSAVKLPLKTDALVLFSDVPNTEWFFQYVMTAYDAKIISGGKDGKFHPNDTITLAENLKIIAEALEVNLPKFSPEIGNIYADVDAKAWYAPYVAYAKEKNIVLADDYGKIYPESSLSRAKFAEIMYRFIYVRDHNGEAFPLDHDWATYEADKLPATVKYPADFKILKFYDNALKELVLWKGDSRFFQFSPEKMYPNTMKFIITLDQNENELKRDEYYANIKQVFGGSKVSDITFGDFKGIQVEYENNFMKDWYVYFDRGNLNGKVLVIYTGNGSGSIAEQQRKILDAMLLGLEYNEISLEDAPDYTKIKSDILKNVLVEGKGNSMLDKLNDEVIIDTDTIGVGTGPVDYYYSAELNLTLKYERSGDVILDTRDGNTTSF